MFRYLGICWRPHAEEHIQAAARFAQRLCQLGWQQAARCAGLAVFTTGHDRGINDAYPLPANQGVVVGRLFRRRSATPCDAGDVELTLDEAERIVATDGRVLLNDFWGRYVAFLPERTGEVRVLRDPTGTLPCYRGQIEGMTIVFSWLEDLFDIFEESAVFTVDWDTVAAQMLLGQIGGQVTAMKEVAQILPGELATLGRPEAPPPRLWRAVGLAGRPLDIDPAEAAGLLRETVRDCALSWASCYDKILLRLSGGVDSTILLNSLCPAISPARIACLNYHSPGSDSDERSYARLAAIKAGTRLLEQHRDTDFQLKTVLDVARTPTPGSYLGRMGTGRLDAAAAAAHGARVLFTGSGGDQLFFERRCTWPAADYLKLRGLDRGFLPAVLDAANLGRVSFWRAACNALADLSFKGSPAAEMSRYLTLMTHDAMQAAMRQLDRVVHPDLLNAPALPIGKYHQAAELVCAPDHYDPYLREASPELVMPLRSQPVVELCLALPTFLLTLGGRGRGLARRAFAGDIPREIAARRSKGSTSDHVASVLRNGLPFARELLLDGRLVQQGLLDRGKLEIALSGQPSSAGTHPAEIHNCIAVEAWAGRLR